MEITDSLIDAAKKSARVSLMTEILAMAKTQSENGERVIIIKDKDWRKLEDKYIFGDKKND